MKELLPLLLIAGVAYFVMQKSGNSTVNASGAATPATTGVLPNDPRVAAGTLPAGTPILSPYSGYAIGPAGQIINTGCAAGSNCGGSGILTGLGGWRA